MRDNVVPFGLDKKNTGQPSGVSLATMSKFDEGFFRIVIEERGGSTTFMLYSPADKGTPEAQQATDALARVESKLKRHGVETETREYRDHDTGKMVIDSVILKLTS